MEPTPQDVAAVAAAMGEQPTQQPQYQQPVQQPQPQYQQPTQPQYQQPTQQPVQQPAQQQPAQPVQQPSPTSQPQDPFSMMFQQPTQAPTQPTQPTEQVPTQQPQQPVEPPQPTPQGQPQYQQPQQQPGQIAQQVQPQQPQQPQAPQTQTYEQYLDSVLQGLPQVPEQPDPSKVNPEDPEAIKGFFNELFTTAEQRFEANYARKMAIQNAEKKLWDDAFDKYGSLRTNTQLRDMVHAIRRAEFSKGNAITPTQAAETLLLALRGQYQQGVADNQVVTTIEQVQPNGGGSTAVPTTMDANAALLAVQTGGEQALAQVLENRMQAGQM